MQDVRSKRHAISSLHLHLIFAAKYRKKLFSPLMMERLKYHFLKVCEDFGYRLVEVSCIPAAYNTLKTSQ